MMYYHCAEEVEPIINEGWVPSFSLETIVVIQLADLLNVTSDVCTPPKWLKVQDAFLRKFESIILRLYHFLQRYNLLLI